ncbi:MAG: hypothetical protein E4H44_03790, partial [Candidatus Aminicenantes bacterium]
MIRSACICLFAFAVVHLSGCAPQSSPTAGEESIPPSVATTGVRPSEPSPRVYVAPPGEISEEAYRAGRPAALMDFLYRYRQPQIPPPGAPITELDLTDLMLDQEVLTAIGTLPDL